MMNGNIIIVAIAIILAYLIYACRPGKSEGFKLFEQRYGLRGDRLRTSDIKHKFWWPQSHYKINKSSGMMYEGEIPPTKTCRPGFAQRGKCQGECQRTDCPKRFGNSDAQCWGCN